MSVFQDLYDSEIDFKIASVWDGGFEVVIGQHIWGQKGEKARVDTWADVESWLVKKAIEHHPNSEFAKKYEALKNAVGAPQSNT